MPNKTLTVDQVMAVLEETVPRIDELTHGASPSQLRTAAGPGEWSALEVLAHLRACADVWGECMVSIAGGTPTLRAVNPLTWIDKTNYRSLEFGPSFRAFAAQRQQLLRALRPLPRIRWSRTSTVSGAGSLLVRDVLFYGRWMAGHERSHVKQIARITSRLRQAVGSASESRRAARLMRRPSR